MITYVSHLFASAAEAAEKLSIYQTPVEEAGGTIGITTWEHKESDRTTRTTESTEQGETTVAATQTVETVLQRGPAFWLPCQRRSTWKPC